MPSKTVCFALLCHVAANLLPLLRLRDAQGNEAFMWGWYMSWGVISQLYDLFFTHPQRWNSFLLAMALAGLSIVLFPAGVGALAVGYRRKSKGLAIFAVSPFVALFVAFIALCLQFGGGLGLFLANTREVWYFPAAYCWFASYFVLAYAAVRLIYETRTPRRLPTAIGPASARYDAS